MRPQPRTANLTIKDYSRRTAAAVVWASARAVRKRTRGAISILGKAGAAQTGSLASSRSIRCMLASSAPAMSRLAWTLAANASNEYAPL